VRGKRPVAISDLKADSVYGPGSRRQWTRGTPRSGHPLIAQDRALGCMNLYLTERHEFDEDEITSSRLGQPGAISIENARLFERPASSPSPTI